MQEYRFKFYLNAMHSILIDDIMGEVHPHTWEIVVDVYKQNNGFLAFTEVEKPVEELLRPFQNKVMNTISPFDALNPTLENVCSYFQDRLETTFVENGFIMTRIEVSETPSRTFIIDIKNDEDVCAENNNTDVLKSLNITDTVEEETDNLIKNKFHIINENKTNTKHSDTFTYTYKRGIKRDIKKPVDLRLYLLMFAVLITLVAAALLFLKG